MKTVESMIARRYLLSRRKVRFINVIGLISVAGITLGVAALLVALSVFNGFNSVVTSVLVGFDPHIRIEKAGGMTERELQAVGDALGRIASVRAWSPFVSGKAMLVSGYATKVVIIRGVRQDRIAAVSGLKDRLKLGSLEFNDSAGVPGIVLGLTLADRLGSIVGDRLQVISPAGMQPALTGLGTPQTVNFRIAGIYESNNRDYDAGYAYISLSAAQGLFQMESRVNGVELRLDDFTRSVRVKSELEKTLPPDMVISTWYDLHENLYSVMLIERWSAYILLCLIIVVASFNMLGSLTMGVIEKRRDIAVLKAIGMTSKSIVRLFMAEGLLIGCIGTFLGVVIGLVVLFLQVQFRIVPLDQTIYIIPAIPVEIRWTDFVAIAGASLGLSFLAAYYPARRAAAVLPAESLRWE